MPIEAFLLHLLGIAIFCIAYTVLYVSAGCVIDAWRDRRRGPLPREDRFDLVVRGSSAATFLGGVLTGAFLDALPHLDLWSERLTRLAYDSPVVIALLAYLIFLWLRLRQQRTSHASVDSTER